MLKVKMRRIQKIKLCAKLKLYHKIKLVLYEFDLLNNNNQHLSTAN